MAYYFDWPTLSFDSSHAANWPLWIVVIIAILVFIPLCTSMQRCERLNTKSTSDALESMTLEEAYSIKLWLAEHEFSMVFSAATAFVFFKSYGIPSIAKLVAGAAHRSSSTSHVVSQKPKLDSSVILANLMGRPGAPEMIAAIDRINHIHSYYRPSGKMSDNDLLYTLSLYVLEVIRWVDKYEWRPLTRKERCALATLWKSLGEKLRIPYNNLPSHQSGFKNALHWLQELEEWGQTYEERNMKRSPDALLVAHKHLDTWLQNVPTSVKPVARSMIAVIIDPELRLAMDINNPSAASKFIVHAIIHTRKFFRRCYFRFSNPFSHKV
ncbi:hypothetical protein F5Y19DRAFT_449589 [Xylariaceae sp. FL1651]|nr:hypothetical protein F5Y19DRAFT_449589 [Xylariaceae sp. FL1651]